MGRTRAGSKERGECWGKSMLGEVGDLSSLAVDAAGDKDDEDLRMIMITVMMMVTKMMRKMGEKNLPEELSWCWWQTAVDFPRGSLAPGFKLIRRL